MLNKYLMVDCLQNHLEDCIIRKCNCGGMISSVSLLILVRFAVVFPFAIKPLLKLGYLWPQVFSGGLKAVTPREPHP